MTYTLSQFPMARQAIEDHESITVNVSDPHADPAEVAIMRRDGDKCLLILPMVHQGQSIGLIEVLDHQRERKFSRQEMRLANAVAAQAAVAVHNATVFAQLTRSDQDVARPAARHRDASRPATRTLHDQTRSGRRAAGRRQGRGAGARRHLVRRELRRRERRSLRDCVPATRPPRTRLRTRHRHRPRPAATTKSPSRSRSAATPATARPSSSASSPPWPPAPS